MKPSRPSHEQLPLQPKGERPNFSDRLSPSGKKDLLLLKIYGAILVVGSAASVAAGIIMRE